MRRRTFDTLVSTGAVIVGVVLLIAGALLTWSTVFINQQVHDQLASQKIFFPAAGSAAIKGAEFKEIQQYAGQQLTTGDQAKAYADHFILVHLNEVADGKTYSQLSSAAMADPTNTKLQGQVNTLFKGTTLRGMLLEAYAFGKVGTIAGIAAFVAFGAAAVMFLLAALGFRHSRHVDAKVELGSRMPAPVEV